MHNENRPPGGENAGTGASESHQLDSTSIPRRVKRSQLRLSEDGRKALDLLDAKLKQRIEEDDEHGASCLARHAVRIHKKSRLALQWSPAAISCDSNYHPNYPSLVFVEWPQQARLDCVRRRPAGDACTGLAHKEHVYYASHKGKKNDSRRRPIRITSTRMPSYRHKRPHGASNAWSR